INSMLFPYTSLFRSDTALVHRPPSGATGLFSGPLLRRTLLILAVWFLVSVSYYGVFTWLPSRLAEEGFGFVRGYGFLVVVALARSVEHTSELQSREN